MAIAYLAIPAVFLISIPIAYFIAPWAGQLFWVSLLFVGHGLSSYSRRKGTE